MDGPVWCAWCAKAIDGEPTLFLGIPFHWRCLKKRKAALTVLPKRKDRNVGSEIARRPAS